MNRIKIINSNLELRKDEDSFIKIIGNKDIGNACLNRDGSLIIMTKSDGKVECYKSY